ncbi:filamentous hemagglutinin-like protein [Nostoc sp. NIES-2111]|nr:filamentous hemagglutinin-like protein [Nostoc sp. NIES-2111]
MSRRYITAGISIILGIGAVISFDHASASEIIPDNTLPENTTITSDKSDENTFIINGGTIVGEKNLFHSFTKFSLLKGQTAYFDSGRNIENIFGRVTGGEISNIDGTIQSGQRFNLFLINPNGFIFGPNARLNVQGSFVVTTANSIRFAEGGEFSAKPVNTTPLLNVTTPIGLQYGANVGSIRVQGVPIIQPTTLQVEGNQTLALLGGDIIIEDTSLGTLKPEGRIELGSVASAGLVGISATDSGFLFKFDGVPELGNIYLNSGTNISSLGDLKITSNNLFMDNANISTTNNLAIDTKESIQLISKSSIVTSNSEKISETQIIKTRNLLVQDSSLIAVNGGNLTIDASDSVKLIGNVEDFPNRIYATASDNSTNDGNLIINTRDLIVKNNSQIITNSTATFSGRDPFIQPTKGSLTINAANSVILQGSSSDEVYPSGIFTQSGGNGEVGDLTINTRVLQVEDGAQVIVRNSSGKKGGNLTVNATDKVRIIGTSKNGTITGDWLDDANTDEPVPMLIAPAQDLAIAGVTGRESLPSGLFTDATSSGDAGSITINTRELTAQYGGLISAETFSAGQGGDLTIYATDKVQLIGTSANGITSGLFTRAGSMATESASAGSLEIFTGNLLVQDGAQVSASTFGAGKGGNVFVKASEGIQLIGVSARNSPSGLFAQANSNATKDAGNLTIETSNLLVRDGAQVSTSTFGTGNGGNLSVKAAQIQLVGTAPKDLFSSGLFAVATPDSTGSAGNLMINADLLQIWQGAGVAVRSSGTGSAGNVDINAAFIRLDDRAFINADTRGNGNVANQSQANINVRSQNLILSRGSNITTNATGENVIGGNIHIGTDTLVASQNSDISANSADFRGGKVKIDAQTIFGIKFRTTSTADSDITATGASPELSGTVEITSPDVDPSQSLTQLPANAIDISRQIYQKCSSGEATAQIQNQFIITGRGGVPENPYEALDNNSVIADWVTVNNANNTAKKESNLTKLVDTPVNNIVEAQGWVVDAKGNLVLTAQAPQVTHHHSGLTAASCQNRG